MKKLFLLLLFVPSFLLAKSNIYIESIDLKENNNVEILNDSTIEELDINLNLKFYEVNSYIIYTINIINNSDEDYEIDNNSININSDYMQYNISCEGNNRIIEHGSDKKCDIKVTYKTAVTNELLQSSNGSVNETKIVNIDLSNVELINPKTGQRNILLLILLILLLSLMMYKYSNKRFIRSEFIIILFLLMIPICTKGLNKEVINLNTNIEIVDNIKKCSHEIHNFKEFIMCEIETDFYDYNIYKLNKLIKENASEEEITSQRKLVYNYEELISRLNWDNSNPIIPNENNYRNAKDGMYTNNSIISLFYKDSTFKDKDSLAFSKMNELTKITDYNIINNTFSHFATNAPTLYAEPVSPNMVDVEFYTTVHTNSKNKTNDEEIEDYVSNGSLSWSIEKCVPETDPTDIRYIINSYMDQHTLSNNLLGRQDQILSEFMDLYVNYENIKNHKWNKYIPITYVRICSITQKYLFEGTENGYLNNTYDNIINGNYDYKTKKYMNNLTLDSKDEYDIALCKRWLQNNKIKDYNNLTNPYNSELEIELTNEYKSYYNFVEETNEDIFSFINIVYNGKYYTGQNAFWYFLSDFYNIEVHDDVKTDVNKYLFDEYIVDWQE